MINTQDPHLYEHLNLIIQAYESASLQSGSRNGYLSTGLSSLDAMEQVIQGSSKAIEISTHPILSTDPQEKSTIDITLDPLAQVEFKDPELQAILGSTNLSEFLAECLNCDSRIQFKWQIQPIDLLPNFDKLLSEITSALDALEAQLNPFNVLADLCNLLNGISWMCLPDLIAVLGSLKMLLQKYLTAQLSINIDWTALIAPLLKAIFELIGSLLSAVKATLLGPLDCSIGALKAAADLEKSLIDVQQTAQAVGQRIKTRTEQATTGIQNLLTEDLTPLPADADTTISIGLNTEEFNEWSFPSGVALTSKVTLPDAIKDPRFPKAHWTTKLTLSVQEAKKYLEELINRVFSTLDSLHGLTTGSINISVGNLGLILFLKDMISLILLIISLFKSNRNIKDWCTHFQDNPEILSESLSQIYGTTDVDVTKEAILLRQQSAIVGRIETCINPSQQSQLSKWITDLQRK